MRHVDGDPTQLHKIDHDIPSSPAGPGDRASYVPGDRLLLTPLEFCSSRSARLHISIVEPWSIANTQKTRRCSAARDKKTERGASICSQGGEGFLCDGDAMGMHRDCRVAVAGDRRFWDRAAQGSKSAGQGAPRLSGRGRDGSCMTLGRVAGNLPDDARAAGLIVALSAALGCAEYIERSSDSIGTQVHGSAKRRVLI